MFDSIPESIVEQARMLENILLTACEGNRSGARPYAELRGAFISDPALKPLLPEFVRTCRDLEHFWSYIKDVAPKWEPRRLHIRTALSPLFQHLEGGNTSPGDLVVSDTLSSFDAEGVHAVWEKALARRHTDPEGAITSARTLLETVCKRVLDECSVTYTDREDLPALYRMVALQLQIAPSQHSEEIFRRILGGATTVVEGRPTERGARPFGRGEVAERLKAPHSKCGIRATVSWVRIPPSPPISCLSSPDT
jgi:hypothetical protein